MRNYNHWIALAAAMIFVAVQHREKPWLSRTLIAGISGAMGHVVAPEFAETFSVPGPIGWTVITTAIGYAVLDIVLALISDRAAIREIAASWLKRK